MNNPVLNGLVLAGGKSLRMGRDKAGINWHGKAQQYYLADLLKNLCSEVFISCSAAQVHTIDPAYSFIPDLFDRGGPYEAILTAFRQKPDCAWLVIACDMPLLDLQTLQYLNKNRNPDAVATVFEGSTNLPEPLAAIWEPASYPLLNISNGKKQISLRIFLIENSAEIIKAPNPGALININTPEEASRISKLLQEKP